MPKQIVTKASLPKMMRELDRWEGKLTWPRFCDQLSKVLGIESVSKHTMYKYPAIVERFKKRQRELKDVSSTDSARDYTLEAALKRVAELEAENSRLRETNELLHDQFRRWQYNAYANNVRMDLLALDKPLPAVDRSGRNQTGSRSGQPKHR